MYPSSEPIDPSVLRLVQGKSLVRIVDDDETVAKSYEFMLRCSGWNCRIFNSAEDYLALSLTPKSLGPHSAFGFN